METSSKASKSAIATPVEPFQDLSPLFFLVDLMKERPNYDSFLSELSDTSKKSLIAFASHLFGKEI